MLENFSYFQVISFSIAASLLCFTIISVIVLLSVFDGSGFITPTTTVFGAAVPGLIVGIIHGLIMGLFLIWKRSDSILNSFTGSFLATEIISLLICVILLFINIKDNLSSNAEPMRFSDYLTSSVWIVTIFLYASIVLVVPAIIIGLVNRLVLFYFR